MGRDQGNATAHKLARHAQYADGLVVLHPIPN